jgi:threonine/homoserine/homoserine lactone efflux protein
VVDLGWWLAATVLTTFGCLSFVLYWIAFAWSGHTLLQDSAILLLTVLVWLGAVVALWLAGGMNDGC